MFINANKIWFSNDKSLFLPKEHQSKLCNLNNSNCINLSGSFAFSKIQVNLIIWKILLNDQAIEEAISFCNYYSINLLDLDAIEEQIAQNMLLDKEIKNKQLQMILVAKLELREWIAEKGGNPAVASDIIRFLPSIMQSTKKKKYYYSDFDIELDIEREIAETILSDEINALLHVSKDFSEINKDCNNDILYFSPRSLLLLEAVDIITKQFISHNSCDFFTKDILRSRLFKYPAAQRYFPINFESLEKNYLEKNPYNIIKKRQLLFELFTPKDIHSILINKSNSTFSSFVEQSIVMITNYCGPIVVEKLLLNSSRKNEITFFSKQSSACEVSWHPFLSIMHKKNKMLFNAYQNNFFLQIFIWRIHQFYKRLGHLFFSSNEITNVMPNTLFSEHEIGYFLYQFRINLVKQIGKYLYDFCKNPVNKINSETITSIDPHGYQENGFSSINLANFFQTVLNSRVERLTDPARVVCYNNILKDISILNETKTEQSFTDLINEEANNFETKSRRSYRVSFWNHSVVTSQFFSRLNLYPCDTRTNELTQNREKLPLENETSKEGFQRGFSPFG